MVWNDHLQPQQLTSVCCSACSTSCCEPSTACAWLYHSPLPCKVSAHELHMLHMICMMTYTTTKQNHCTSIQGRGPGTAVKYVNSPASAAAHALQAAVSRALRVVPPAPPALWHHWLWPPHTAAHCSPPAGGWAAAWGGWQRPAALDAPTLQPSAAAAIVWGGANGESRKARCQGY
jgi:hypothetical protein